MAKVGRKTKQTEDNVRIAVKLAKEGKTITEICRFLDIKRQTYYSWTKNNPLLKEVMDEEIKKARQKELENVKKSLYKMTQKHKVITIKEITDSEGKLLQTIKEVKECPPNITAINTYLERNEEKYSEASEETNGFRFEIVDTSPVRKCDIQEEEE